MEISQDALSRYIRNRSEDLRKCREYFGTKNFEEIERIGHKLKGNGSTFGFPDLSKIGMELEVHAKKEDLSALQKVLESLARWLREKTN